MARPQNLDGSQQSDAHGKWAPHSVALLVYGLAAFILLMGAPGAAILSVTMFPATALLMDGMFCDDADQLQYSKSYITTGPREGSDVTFACIGPNGSTNVESWAVTGLQTLVAVGFTSVVIAIAGLMVWRLTSPRR